MKYEIGDKVIIANEDKIYQYWEDWFDEYKVNKTIKAHFNSGKWPDVSHTFNVVAVGYNHRYTDYAVYAIRDKNEDVYLIAEEGIKKVKKSKKQGIKEIANYYGYEHQKVKAIEEMCELITELSKGNEVGIIEEIADVQIMMEQLEILCTNSAEVKKTKKHKIKRQLKRIKIEKTYYKSQDEDFTIHIIEGGVSIEN